MKNEVFKGLFYYFFNFFKLDFEKPEVLQTVFLEYIFFSISSVFNVAPRELYL